MSEPGPDDPGTIGNALVKEIATANVHGIASVALARVGAC